MAALFFLGLWAAVGLWYLSSRHQRLLARPLPARWAHGVALMFAAAALTAGTQRFGGEVTAFASLAWVMLCAGLWPLLPVVARRARP